MEVRAGSIADGAMADKFIPTHRYCPSTSPTNISKVRGRQNNNTETIYSSKMDDGSGGSGVGM